MSNEKKIAFITGGNRGVGLQTARDLGKQGYAIVIGVRDVHKGEDAVVSLRKDGISAEAIEYDGARPATDRSVVAYFEKRGGKLDVLVNNAGTLEEPLGGNTTSTVTPETVEHTFATNVFAPVRLTQALLPLLKRAPAARIVNVSSILGSLTLHADPSSPITPMKAFAYNASKAALNAFTVHLAAELAGTNVKVNSAHPGWVKTELGGPNAPMEIRDSGKTSTRLATLPTDGPSGGFFHEDQSLPW